MLDMLFAVSLLATVGAIAVPQMLGGIDRVRSLTAARYLAQQCGVARFRAVGRGRTVALRFTERRGNYVVQMFGDGNGNGVRATDVAAGIDLPLSAEEDLSSQFPGVRIALDPSLGLGSDPVRLGGSHLLSFTPLGTATAGTVYVLGTDGQQLAVRVLGVTARARVMRFERSTAIWEAQ